MLVFLIMLLGPFVLAFADTGPSKCGLRVINVAV